MTKWEYCKIVFTVRDANDEEQADAKEKGLPIEFVEANDSKVYARYGILTFLNTPENTQNITKLSQTVAELGLDGWEMVGFGAPVFGSYNWEIIYFKRALKEQ